MSTVKSSSENLTLNADGVGSDVVIQNNGTETVRIDSSGTVTATAFSGDLDLNSNDITGTGNVDITGTVTSDDLIVDGGTFDSRGVRIAHQNNINQSYIGAYSEADTNGTSTRIRFGYDDGVTSETPTDINFVVSGTEVMRINNGGVEFIGAIDEKVYNLTGTALDPSNGTIQYKTLTANTTLTDSLSEGEAITLMIDDGSAYTLTFPTITWVNNGGTAPTLATTGYTVFALWKVGSTLYGALVGDGS